MFNFVFELHFLCVSKQCEYSLQNKEFSSFKGKTGFVERFEETIVSYQNELGETKTITLLTKPLISSGQLWFLSSSQVLKVQSKPFIFYTKISNDTIVQLDSLGKKEAIPIRRYAALRAFTSAFIGTGNDGGKAKDLADFCIIAPGNHTGTIQEIHIQTVFLL